MKSESEVTKMCTPADEQILIVGTDVGSLALYDLTAFESAGLKTTSLITRDSLWPRTTRKWTKVTQTWRKV